MKDRILAVASGKLNYEPAKLQLSERELRLIVVAGHEVTGSFVIRNERGTKLKGFLCSDDFSIPFLPVFHGEENEICYTVSARDKVPGETMKGVIHLVTDCGQTDIPYYVEVTAPILKDEQGVINDYYLLQERIRTDYETGAALFHSKEFKEVFLFRDESGCLLYDELNQHNTKLQSMEEFLVARGKKEAVTFSLEKENYDFTIEGEEEIESFIKLRTNTWGTAGIRIQSSDEAVVPAKGIVWSESFIGNETTVPFVIDGHKVGNGTKTVLIRFQSPNEVKMARIRIHRNGGEMERKLQRHHKKYLWAFCKNYMNFVVGQISELEYQNNLKRVMQELEDCSHPIMELLRGYSYVEAEEMLSQGMDLAAGYVLEIERQPMPPEDAEFIRIFNYLGGLAVRSLYTKAEADRSEAAKQIRHYYENGNRRWEIFYLLFKTDRRYEKMPPALVLEEMSEFFADGCHSPFLYIEAVKQYKRDLSLLHHLDKDNIRILYFGMKAGMFGQDFALHLSFLAERVRSFSELLFECLVIQYKKYKLDDTLQSICSMLIKSEKTGKQYFQWFALGVEKRLRITELFEYYMYTLDRESEVSLPQSVISYFQYENHLGDSLKAWLYASIVKERLKRPKNFQAYSNTIKEYALRKLANHQISRSLGTIYEGILGREDISASVAKELPQVMFRYLLTCHSSDISEVVVAHMETKKKVHYPLTDGQAIIEIFTPNYQVYFVDKDKHYRVATVEHTLEKLVNMDALATICFENGSEYMPLLISLLVKIQRSYKMSVSEAVLCHLVTSQNVLRPEFQGKVLYSLYESAKERKDAEFLEQVLGELDLELIKPEKRGECITACICTGLYEKAWQAAEKFGPQDIELAQLYSLVCWYTQNPENECTPFAQKVCFYLYESGYKEAPVLSYLLQYYMGRSESLHQILSDACQLKLEIAESVSERLLAQVIFSWENPAPFYELYKAYYRTGENRILARAVTNYIAYGYLTEKYDIEAELFSIFQRESSLEENYILLLAVLKYFGEQKTLSSGEKGYVDMQISRLAKMGVVMKFMQQFDETAPLPDAVRNAVIVQHFSGTKLPIMVEYRTGNQKESVAMRQVIPGVFVREFLLFGEETITYEIIEEETGERFGPFTEKARQVTGENSFFAMANEMLMLQKSGDLDGSRQQYKKIRQYEEIAKKILEPF